MSKEPEMGFIPFNPPIIHKSSRYYRAWELLKDMDLVRQVAFCYQGNMELHALVFPTKQEAMIFKLRF